MGMGRVTYSPISSYSRVQILHLVQTRPQRSVAELCEATGLHANTVREHLQRLIEGGYVVQATEHRTTRGRPRTLYSAATGTAEASSPIAMQKAMDAARRGDLMRRLVSGTSSRLEGKVANQMDALVEHLEESGFEPLVDDAELTVDLTPCPHAEGLPEDRPMLCAVHLGLMQGVLAAAGGPLEAVCVQSTARATECAVQLRLAEASGAAPRAAALKAPELRGRSV